MAHLLPPNASTAEIALSETTERLVLPVEIPMLWAVDTCPAALLPWLAWAMSVDEWDDGWSEAVKRRLISDAYQIHSHKGTAYAIKRALQAIGYDNVAIQESRVDYYNGTYHCNGAIDHGSNQIWPLFDVALNIGYVPDVAMVAEIRARIDRYKNERSILRTLTFMDVLYNDSFVYNGVHTHNGGALFNQGLVTISYNNSIAHNGAYTHNGGKL